jgi:DNA polymerase I-like protein with 3'-5' exonuclease and polymerase domains
MTIRNYGAIGTVEELKEFVDRVIAGGRPFGYDCETGYHGEDREKGSIHRETAIVVGISFTDSLDWARYAPLAHDVGENLDNYRAAQLFWDLLSTGRGVAHNAGFELKQLSKWFLEQLADDPERGEQVRASGGYFPIRSDTLIEAYLAAEYQWFGLKYLTKEMFGHSQTELHELFGEDFKVKNRKFMRFNQLELTPRVVNYACEDSVWCLAIHQHYYDKVKDRLLFTVEKAIITDVLPAMEDEGIVYDWPLMRRTADRLRDFRDRFNAEIMADLSEMAGEPTAINLASPLQVRKILYAKLGMKTTVFTDKTRDLESGKRVMSTGDLALRKLADKFPVVKKVLQWREQTKLLGTYLDKYEKAYNYAADGRAHPSHLSAFVITGRFAHSDPNYAQSPKKYHFDLIEAKLAHAAGEEPPPGTCFKFNFRDVIKAPAGWYVLGFDLSQAELRAIAGEAQEHALLEAFENGDDVHRVTASLMLGVPLEEITEEQRAIGKAQPLDAGIMTPAGPRRMGDLQVGDFVIGSDGLPTKVTGVFPQGRKEVFRVTTSDGASTECCGEHLWTVQNVNIKKAKRKWVTRELKELVASGLTRTSHAVQPKYQLPDRKPVQFEPQPDLPIDPYVLGALLGDGGLTHSWCPSFGSADQELLDAVRGEHERFGGRWASETETSPGFRVAYLAAGERFKRGTNKIKDALRDLGLWDHRDCDKFVPVQYLYASPEDRLALLQGLLDTDGCVQASGAMFRVTSKDLAEAAQFLARSLGGWASLKPMPRAATPYHIKSEPKPIWTVYLRLPGELCPFRLTRKIDKWKKPVYRAPQTIISVDMVGEKEAQCISVSAADGLYLSDTFIYSHNTLNFALLYGMSTKGLADRLALPLDEAQVLMDKYFAGLSAIATYMDKQVRLGKEQGYVESRFGRTLPIWEYQSDNPYIRAKGDRACVNYPIQGAATGDYMKIAMVRVVHALRKAGLADKVRLVMNVHDALEFYVHASLGPEEVIAVLKPAVIFEVPGWPTMKADWHIARRWGSPTEIELHDDGTITAKGARIEEVLPSIEIDEEGNEIVAMPEVDEQVLHEVAAAPGRHVLVTLRDMPTNDTWLAFKLWLADLRGRNVVTLVTPEGELRLPVDTSLSPSHLGAVNQMFPGATIEYLADNVEDMAVDFDFEL